MYSNKFDFCTIFKTSRFQNFPCINTTKLQRFPWQWVEDDLWLWLTSAEVGGEVEAQLVVKITILIYWWGMIGEKRIILFCVDLSRKPQKTRLQTDMEIISFTRNKILSDIDFLIALNKSVNLFLDLSTFLCLLLLNLASKRIAWLSQFNPISHRVSDSVAPIGVGGS